MFDKCPKCEEFDCDCVVKEDEIEPMLVMHKPQLRDGNSTSIPFYIPLNRVPTVHKFDLEKVPRPLNINFDVKPASSRHKIETQSKEEVMKNGTIPEEDKVLSDDSANIDEDDEDEGVVHLQCNKAVPERSSSVEYSSRLDVTLAKPKQEHNTKENNEEHSNDSNEKQ